MITYNTKLTGNTDDLKRLMEMQRIVFNFASNEQFKEKKFSLPVLHSKVYSNIRKMYPDIPSQVVIKSEQECLSSYRTCKSNKHRLSNPIEKKNLSMRLDKRLYSCLSKDSIRITTTGKREVFHFKVYQKLKELFDEFTSCDPLIYEKNGDVWISFSFENKPLEKIKQKLCLGVDVGIRRSVALSDGRLIIDKQFNKEKRRLRFLKRQLQSCGTKSSRKHLQKLRNKEKNKNKNQTHLISNIVLDTKADTIVLENLKGIKRKKNKYQNKRSISQVPMFDLRRIITYKAENSGKTVLLVCPSYTSQTDSITGKREGERRGCRFYSKNRLVYDADINASINIAKKAKLPISQTNNLTYGQALINVPNVCKTKNMDSLRYKQIHLR